MWAMNINIWFMKSKTYVTVHDIFETVRVRPHKGTKNKLYPKVLVSKLLL